jgi:HAAS domain-containing protein
MSATIADVRVRTYLDAVRAYLDDLPENDRDELLEDLEEHLLEVAAEDDAPLEDRLGPPATYAEELRVSAGLPSRDQVAARGIARRIGDRLAASPSIRRLDSFRQNKHAQAVLAFLEECRPGWWVARGYLATLVVATISSGGRESTGTPIVPVISDSATLGAAIAGGAIVVSVWLGLRARDRNKGTRLSVLLTVGVVAASAAMIGGAGWGPAYAYDEESGFTPPYLHHADGSPIANICPYSSDGKLLTGVLLFDQSGRPISNASDWAGDEGPVERLYPSISNAFPLTIRKYDPVTGNLLTLACPGSIGAPAPAPPGLPTPSSP